MAIMGKVVCQYLPMKIQSSNFEQMISLTNFRQIMRALLEELSLKLWPLKGQFK